MKTCTWTFGCRFSYIWLNLLMRIWYIPLSLLDNRRVTGQHKEIHMLVSCLRNGTEWAGLVKRFTPYGAFLEGVHQQSLFELHRRSVRKLPTFQQYLQEHKSPFDASAFTPRSMVTQFHASEDLIIKDMTDLREKWEAEAYLNGFGTQPLSSFESLAEIKSRPQEQAQNIHFYMKRLYKENKILFAFQGRIRDKMKLFFRNKSNNPFIIKIKQELQDSFNYTYPVEKGED